MQVVRGLKRDLFFQPDLCLLDNVFAELFPGIIYQGSPALCRELDSNPSLHTQLRTWHIASAQ